MTAYIQFRRAAVSRMRTAGSARQRVKAGKRGDRSYRPEQKARKPAASDSETAPGQLVAPGYDVGAGDDAEHVAAGDAGKTGEMAYRGLVDAPRARVGDVGKPLDLRGDVGQVVKLSRRQQAVARDNRGRRGRSGFARGGRGAGADQSSLDKNPLSIIAGLFDAVTALSSSCSGENYALGTGQVNDFSLKRHDCPCIWERLEAV